MRRLQSVRRLAVWTNVRFDEYRDSIVLKKPEVIEESYAAYKMHMMR